MLASLSRDSFSLPAGSIRLLLRSYTPFRLDDDAPEDDSPFQGSGYCHISLPTFKDEFSGSIASASEIRRLGLRLAEDKTLNPMPTLPIFHYYSDQSFVPLEILEKHGGGLLPLPDHLAHSPDAPTDQRRREAYDELKGSPWDGYGLDSYRFCGNDVSFCLYVPPLNLWSESTVAREALLSVGDWLEEAAVNRMIEVEGEQDDVLFAEVLLECFREGYGDDLQQENPERIVQSHRWGEEYDGKRLLFGQKVEGQIETPLMHGGRHYWGFAEGATTKFSSCSYHPSSEENEAGRDDDDEEENSNRWRDRFQRSLERFYEGDDDAFPAARVISHAQHHIISRELLAAYFFCLDSEGEDLLRWKELDSSFRPFLMLQSLPSDDQLAEMTWEEFVAIPEVGDMLPCLNTELLWSLSMTQMNSLEPSDVEATLRCEDSHFSFVLVSYDEETRLLEAAASGSAGAMVFRPQEYSYEMISDLVQNGIADGWSEDQLQLALFEMITPLLIASVYPKMNLPDHERLHDLTLLNGELVRTPAYLLGSYRNIRVYAEPGDIILTGTDAVLDTFQSGALVSVYESVLRDWMEEIEGSSDHPCADFFSDLPNGAKSAVGLGSLLENNFPTAYITGDQTGLTSQREMEHFGHYVDRQNTNRNEGHLFTESMMKLDDCPFQITIVGDEQVSKEWVVRHMEECTGAFGAQGLWEAARCGFEYGAVHARDRARVLRRRFAKAFEETTKDEE